MSGQPNYQVCTYIHTQVPLVRAWRRPTGPTVCSCVWAAAIGLVTSVADTLPQGGGGGWLVGWLVAAAMSQR